MFVSSRPAHDFHRKPGPRLVFAREIEVPYVGADEVVGDARDRGRDAAVRNQRDFFDFAMMVAHELEMRHQRAEIMPARKLVRLDNHAMEDAVAIEIVVDAISE